MCFETNDTSRHVPPGRAGLFSTLRSHSDVFPGAVEKPGSRARWWGERPVVGPAGATVWAPGAQGLVASAVGPGAAATQG